MEIADLRIIAQPATMDTLIYWRRQVKGEHPNRAAYREGMIGPQAVTMGADIELVGPNRQG